MMRACSVRHYPVFEPGLFDRHQELFDQFRRDTSDRFRRRCAERSGLLRACEGRLTWPEVAGPGFCGATHPGAGNVFTRVLLGDGNVYNSDCVYINPSLGIFVVADAPGVSTAARQLLEGLDKRLAARGVADLEAIINELNQEMGGGNSATLSLLYCPEDRGRALAFIAGDSCVFHGNLVKRTVRRIEGVSDFMGLAWSHLSPVEAGLAEGDFFIIVSDGIPSLRAGNGQDRKGLEEILLDYAVEDPENFAVNVVRRCNRIFRESHGDKEITHFMSGDNVSALLVYPGKLAPGGGEGSFILGGYVTEGSSA